MGESKIMKEFLERSRYFRQVVHDQDGQRVMVLVVCVGIESLGAPFKETYGFGFFTAFGNVCTDSVVVDEKPISKDTFVCTYDFRSTIAEPEVKGGTLLTYALRRRLFVIFHSFRG